MLRLLFKIGLLIFILGLTVLSISGLFPWPFNLADHFKLQYFITQLIIMVAWIIVCLFIRKQGTFLNVILILHLAGIGLNAYWIVPFYIDTTLKPRASDNLAGQFKLLHMNVLGTNKDYERAAKEIQRENPDIISFQEYNNSWQKLLPKTGALKQYPYFYAEKWTDDAVYSKIPFDSVRIERVSPRTFKADTAIIIRIQLKREPVTLLFSHPPTPIQRKLVPRQNAHFTQWAQNRKTYGENFIIVGDLNTTPWSPPLQDLMRQANLKDSQRGQGLQRSYPAFNWVKRISIDQCLVSERFVVINRHLGSNIGSDHLPVSLELGLKKRAVQTKK